MNTEKLSLRVGAGVVALALLLRLLGSGVLEPIIQTIVSPETIRILLFLETGRYARTPEATPETETPAEPVQLALPADFQPEDADLVKVNSYNGYEADPAALLQMPLTWDLTDHRPRVLILHSHGSESYENTENYTASGNYRTLDTQYNMISLGDQLAMLLEDAGIEVIHDRTMHDSPSYTDAYNQARKSIQSYLKEYPDICLVLDLHRDALQDKNGNQIGYTVDVGGEKAAKVMLVVGTDKNGLKHPNWKENLALAVKLHAQMEKIAPGLCRPISFRAQRFNQDLSTGALIVEVGAAGNTRQEALNSLQPLAQSIIALAHGTEAQVW